MELRLAGIERESVVDGPGLRYVLFTQGCPHHCPDCHNPHTHDPNGGQVYKVRDLLREIAANPLLRGVTFSGGEPFLQPLPLIEMARSVRSLGLDVMTYSGWTYEELTEWAKREPEIGELVQVTDLLVDGPYMRGQRDLHLPFRGSTNQRLIDVQATLENCGVVLYHLSA